MERILISRLVFALAILLFMRSTMQAQCSGCTTNVMNGVASYTAASGQTLCVAPGLNYTGTLVLNGGTICNSGTVNIITFLNGTFRNYGVYNGGNVSPVITGTINAHNYTGSAFRMGAFTFSANNAARIMNIIIYEGASATFTSNIVKNQGALNFEIGNTTSGMAPTLNSTLTVTGLFTVRTGSFAMTVQSNGTVSVSDILSLESTGVKSITNYGTILLTKDLNMISAGSSASTVTINNYGRIDARAVNANYTAGRVFINNYIGSTNDFNISTSLTLSRTTNTLTNTGRINITQNYVSQAGVSVNSGTITNNTLSASGGTITNNNLLKSNTDFLLTNANVRLHNNGSILVSNTFSNIAIVNTASNSLIYTKNYYNSATTSTIAGPTGVIDTANYAFIAITDYSDNRGGLSGKILVNDLSLQVTASNINYGFDVVVNPAKIANTVLFAPVSLGPTLPATPNCFLLINKYSVTATAFPQPVCSFIPVQLTSQFFLKLPNNNLIPINLASNSYTWQPSNLIGQNQTVQNGFTTTYTVYVKFGACQYSVTVTNTVSDLVVNPGNDNAVLANTIPSPVINLGGSPTAAGGTPGYSYSWQPSNILSCGNCPNPTMSQALASTVTFTLTVVDTQGCNLQSNVTIYVVDPAYAVLKRNYDGGFYKITNGQIYFKYDGEYNTGSLDYKIYNNVYAQVNLGPNPTLIKNLGDNRFTINANALPAGYYKLEVTNEKNEKFVLKMLK